MSGVTRVAALVLLLAGAALAGDKIKPTVAFARSWDAAVEEAKLLNVPIVVHSHGFYCGGCWGMHSSVLQNKKYMDLAGESCVDVLVLSRLEEGIEKHDAKAETYEAVDAEGNKVQRFVSWPSLTLEEIQGFRGTKAASYNQSGKIPYTSIVNPYTLEEMQSWVGGQSAKTIMDAILEHQKALEKEHGPSLGRSVLTKFQGQETAVREALEKQGVAKAMTLFRGLERFAEKYGDAMKAKAAELGEALMAAAKAELDKAAALIESGDLKAAKKILSSLRSALRGTDLATRLEELLEKANTA